MAMQEANLPPAPSAQVIGNAFVEQYYHILHQSPELVYRFYQDSSLLSRPDINGDMKLVTTLQEINEKILSLNYNDYTVEIKSADAQESYEKGVLVLVTGCLTGKDNSKKKFTQTFFLAPQDKGYFVFNDIFRYLEDNETLSPVSGMNKDAHVAALPLEPEPIHAADRLVVDPVAPFVEEDLNNSAKVCDPSDNEEGSVTEVEVMEAPTHSNQSENLPGVDPVFVSPEDTPKKSYASIVKVPKSNTVPVPVYVPRITVRPAPTNTYQEAHSTVKVSPAPKTSGVTSDSGPESSNVHEEDEGHSIYVRNLPYNATVAQLEELFKTFGPIKRDGIQVRSNKEGFTFGFVEFKNLISKQKALEASPISIGGCQAVIEEKRTTTRVGSTGVRGRYSPGRGNFRNDSFRGRGNFGSGGGSGGSSRGFARNEFRNQGEFSARPRGSAGRSGEGYQRVNQNGSGRGGRQIAIKINSDAA